MHIKDELGPPSVFTCPDCHGALWEIEDGDLIRFRCHIGHSYTSRVLLSAASDEVEQALSSALRTHKERTELLRRMAEDAAATGHAHLAERYRRRAAEFETEAATIQRALSGASDPESWIDEMEAAD
jgi:two-component system chemotaxis response regulator CheB